MTLLNVSIRNRRQREATHDKNQKQWYGEREGLEKDRATITGCVQTEVTREQDPRWQGSGAKKGWSDRR